MFAEPENAHADTPSASAANHAFTSSLRSGPACQPDARRPLPRTPPPVDGLHRHAEVVGHVLDRPEPIITQDSWSHHSSPFTPQFACPAIRFVSARCWASSRPPSRGCAGEATASVSPPVPTKVQDPTTGVVSSSSSGAAGLPGRRGRRVRRFAGRRRSGPGLVDGYGGGHRGRRSRAATWSRSDRGTRGRCATSEQPVRELFQSHGIRSRPIRPRRGWRTRLPQLGSGTGVGSTASPVGGVGGGLGRVLREVPGDLLRVQGPLVRWCGRRPSRGGVDPGPERQHPGYVTIEQGGAMNPTDATASSTTSASSSALTPSCRREHVVGLGPVEPDESVEVDQPAALVLGHLGVLHARVVLQPGLLDPEPVSQRPLDRDVEPPPQFGCPPLPHDVGGIVVALPAQGLPQQLVPVLVLLVAGGGSAVLAPWVLAWGRQRRPLSRRPWTCPNDGAVTVAKTSGFSPTRSGTPLPPATPARMRWNMSAA